MLSGAEVHGRLGGRGVCVPDLFHCSPCIHGRQILLSAPRFWLALFCPSLPVLASLGGTRNVVGCIFSCTNRSTDYTEKYFVRRDMTEEFRFLATKLSPYYDR